MINFYSFKKRRFLISLISGATCLLSACQSHWYPDSDLGSSVTNALNNQYTNPNAPLGNPIVTEGLDGVAAKSGVDNYQKSFEVKAPSSGGTYPASAPIGNSSGSR